MHWGGSFLLLFAWTPNARKALMLIRSYGIWPAFTGRFAVADREFSEPSVATWAGRSFPVLRAPILGIVTGKWPWIGISPKSARTALISETVAFENVQM